MAIRNFILDPSHVHTYILIKDVEIIEEKSIDPKVADTLGTSLIKELVKTGKPE